jgi:hypothetical protein
MSSDRFRVSKHKPKVPCPHCKVWVELRWLNSHLRYCQPPACIPYKLEQP